MNTIQRENKALSLLFINATKAFGTSMAISTETCLFNNFKISTAATSNLDKWAPVEKGYTGVVSPIFIEYGDIEFIVRPELFIKIGQGSTLQPTVKEFDTARTEFDTIRTFIKSPITSAYANIFKIDKNTDTLIGNDGFEVDSRYLNVFYPKYIEIYSKIITDPIASKAFGLTK
jgi:hypothetical protein